MWHANATQIAAVFEATNLVARGKRNLGPSFNMQSRKLNRPPVPCSGARSFPHTPPKKNTICTALATRCSRQRKTRWTSPVYPQSERDTLGRERQRERERHTELCAEAGRNIKRSTRCTPRGVEPPPPPPPPAARAAAAAIRRRERTEGTQGRARGGEGGGGGTPLPPEEYKKSSGPACLLQPNGWRGTDTSRAR